MMGSGGRPSGQVTAVMSSEPRLTHVTAIVTNLMTSSLSTLEVISTSTRSQFVGKWPPIDTCTHTHAHTHTHNKSSNSNKEMHEVIL